MVLDLANCPIGCNVQDKISVGQHDEVRIMRCHQELLSGLSSNQIWGDNLGDVAVVQIVLGLVDYQRTSLIAEKKREDRYAALPSRKVLYRHETSIAD